MIITAQEPDASGCHFRIAFRLPSLGAYQENTPGVQAVVDASTAMGSKSEPQPDAMLRILSECGGRTLADRRFIRGFPELLAEDVEPGTQLVSATLLTR
jgi:hypothetical protein